MAHSFAVHTRPKVHHTAKAICPRPALPTGQVAVAEGFFANEMRSHIVGCRAGRSNPRGGPGQSHGRRASVFHTQSIAHKRQRNCRYRIHSYTHLSLLRRSRPNPSALASSLRSLTTTGETKETPRRTQVGVFMASSCVICNIILSATSRIPPAVRFCEPGAFFWGSLTNHNGKFSR